MLRSALFWDITQRREAILYRVSGQLIGPIFKGRENGTDTFSRNIGKGLRLDAE
jgi:hypothetical protein